jgi:hypothetical protein
MFAKINQKILSVVSLVISTSVLSIALSSAFVVVSQKTAQAGDLSWSGLYRIEYFQSENLELDGVKRRDGYFLHHLVMSPKFTAADGLTIYSRFDLLNNCQFGQNGQAGQLLGDGITNSPNCSTATPTPAAGKSNVFSSSQNPESLLVNQLYLTWVQEFGALIVGRAPLQFGLGLTYNAGNGPFDHWFTNEDMVGYKFVFGNLFVLPMLGKVQQGSSTGANNLDIGGSINDYMIQVQYENPETDLALGVFAQIRVANSYGDDSPAGPNAIGGPTAVRKDSFKNQSINFFAKQKTNDFSIGAEAGIQTGTTGTAISGTGGDVSINTYGIAAELGYAPKSSSWSHLLKVGAASGDDPGTNDIYEGFTFNRNYQVAMLMFNRPLGSGNFFRTQLIRNTTTNASDNIDNEALSNAIFIAPSTDYKVRDNLSWGATLLYARLQADPFINGATAAGTSKDLGFETDFRLNYKPYERFTWLTELGFLFPGSAWVGGANNFNNSFAYGLSTKAAISF